VAENLLHRREDHGDLGDLRAARREHDDSQPLRSADARSVPALPRPGGRIQFIAQLDGKPNGLDRGIEEAVEADATAAVLVGNLGDAGSRQGDAGAEKIRDFVAKVQAHGIPAGVAGHEIRTAKLCEEKNIAPDF